jgi:hypothetical protein
VSYALGQVGGDNPIPVRNRVNNDDNHDVLPTSQVIMPLAEYACGAGSGASSHLVGIANRGRECAGMLREQLWVLHRDVMRAFVR